MMENIFTSINAAKNIKKTVNTLLMVKAKESVDIIFVFSISFIRLLFIKVLMYNESKFTEDPEGVKVVILIGRKARVGLL